MRRKTTTYYLTEKAGFVTDIVRQLSKEGTVYYHHGAMAAGYIHVGEAEIDLYDGRFGKGLIVKYNNPLTHRYCYIEYYLADSIKTVRNRLVDELYLYQEEVWDE